MRKAIRLVCRVGRIRFTNRATVSLGDIFDAQTEDEARELVNNGYAEVLSEREERTMKDEEDEEDDYKTFEKWFEENETMFSHAQYSDKDIGYAAWLEGRKHEIETSGDQIDEEEEVSEETEGKIQIIPDIQGVLTEEERASGAFAVEI